ncbi:hypothetical protein PTSG_12029 [Salpingoeca rosetta]|uniref:Sulfotransferase domain-containing protein n=1 Tax=Salpingoeca rosetta (strain ATCC 50818 / BSB-021) TaxID=946362 RepID=F2U5A5_SALR5|nr:uncharacterized protein PTSG_12029 [Salpingoeca rosetta]EGD82821.1 hypothetical protein PTSG_12029 [Salpingoeca rosetta]|eukprot:XP_004996056.1 hypothetical protein PTSG_12029 [Salpingoeca rosetta]
MFAVRWSTASMLVLVLVVVLSLASAGGRATGDAGESTLGPLPRDMQNHTFVFIVGAHHSGTTLLDLVLCQHPNMTCLMDTGVSENEGQHLQHVYTADNKLGGVFRYGFSPQSYLNDTSPLLTLSNRRSIFDAWAAFWNMSRPVLIEKSPSHMVKMKFFQAMFTPQRTVFLFMLRHPLGATHYSYVRHPPHADCGARLVEHWLVIHDQAVRDLPAIQRAAVVQFEAFLGSSDAEARGHVAALERTLGLQHGIKVQFDVRYSTNTNTNTNGGGGSGRWRQSLSRFGRRLTEYHGNKHHVRVMVGTAMAWVRDWQRLMDMKSPACQRLLETYEERVNAYGYSLADPTRVATPHAMRKYLLSLEAAHLT